MNETGREACEVHDRRGRVDRPMIVRRTERTSPPGLACACASSMPSRIFVRDPVAISAIEIRRRPSDRPVERVFRPLATSADSPRLQRRHSSADGSRPRGTSFPVERRRAASESPTARVGVDFLPGMTKTSFACQISMVETSRPRRNCRVELVSADDGVIPGGESQETASLRPTRER